MTPGPPSPVDPCPLCGEREARLVARTPYWWVWDQLEAAHGRPIPPAVQSSLTPSPTADLVRCTGCALEYFTPHNPGGAEFYAELSRDEGYYDVVEKWEFTQASRLLRPGDAVLDVGCGDGVFLRSIEAAARRRVGLDANPWAVEKLRRDGIEGHCATIEAFAPEHRGAFDLVVMFQVIEHLSDVVPPVTAAATCVRPGGHLLISVPNRDRFRLGHDPWDFPPHHLSRWGPAQMEALGRLAGVEVAEVRVQRRSATHLVRDAGRIASRVTRRASPRRRPAPSGAAEPTAPPPADRPEAPAPPPRYRPDLTHLRIDHTLMAIYRP